MNQRLEIILISLCFAGAVFAFHGATGSFLPNVSGRLLYIHYFAEIGENTEQSVPGFYALGGILTLITNISPDQVIYYPILALPSIAIFYVLMRKLSSSVWIAILLVGVLFISNSQGSRVLFYQHGFGAVLFFTVVFGTLLYLHTNKKAYMVLITLPILILITISYNHTFRAVVFLAILSILLWITYNLELMDISRLNYRLLGVLALAVPPIIYLTPWFHSIFLPRFFVMSASTAALEIFQLQFFSGSNGGDNIHPVAHLIAIQRPIYIVQFGIVKYILFAIATVSFWLAVLQGLYRRNHLTPAQGVTIALYVTIGLYFFVRLSFGQLSFTLLFIPSLFALATLYQMDLSPPIKQAVPVVAMALLLVSAAIFAGNVSTGHMERTETGYTHTEPAAKWYGDYGDGTIATDVRTQYLLTYHLLGDEFESGNSNAISELLFQTIRVMSLEGTLSHLLQIGESTGPDADYVVIEHEQDVISVPGWVDMKPWSELEEEYMSNHEYVKAYDSGDIEFLKVINQ